MQYYHGQNRVSGHIMIHILPPELTSHAAQNGTVSKGFPATGQDSGMQGLTP